MTQTMTPDALHHPQAATVEASPPDPEVVAVGVARRRQFSKAEKLRIVKAADQCKQRGDLGALLRREGIYASTLSTWRHEVAEEGHRALAPQKRGPKPNPVRADERRIDQLVRENARLTGRLARAVTIIAAQKKLCNLLGLPAEPDLDESS